MLVWFFNWTKGGGGVLWQMRLRTPLPGAPQASFEITINGELIFSKIALGGFPCENDVREQVQRAHDGQKLNVITKHGGNSCLIM
uniref:Selenoprotein W n=1 Tax=Knipowitschia caucasica TaxID=637954 RepID=A0AAV2KE86_KNICA